MYKVREVFHKQYEYLYDRLVKIYFKDGTLRIG